ncbi:hypothetical protein [Psychroserpens algicola]|uniref:DUF2383 domain-containing protein n=1 Tax=Psychroserpens algicola TaxID=1719034 RepID=A0ABT0H3V7_9FLAO|nr:hypothetical protein [Psychroserpens algicola]MCK8479054.1 hypothetical protein [Psychroserpens algicola]
MNNEAFPYKSVHEYIEEELTLVSNPSHEQIRKTKQAYWKRYYKHYRRQRRNIRKEFTLGFDKERLQLIDTKRGELSISKFLYLIIDRELESNETLFNNQEQLSELHLQLMKLISLTEELLDNVNSELIHQILERLETLEKSFEQVINP